jgi:hypothetical protein
VALTQSLIKRLGSKYMPPNAIHWSELPPERQQAMIERAPILKENHLDWLFFRIPRMWTTWWAPYPARKIRGNAQEVIWTAEDGTEHPYCKPIPLPGEWFENPGRTDDIVGYHAETDIEGNINRRGARWDDSDAYYSYPSFRAGSFTDFFRELFK